MPKQHYKILIIGGYGVFGGRLAHLLSDHKDIELIIAGRNRAKAEAFCTRQNGNALFTPLEFDRANIKITLETLSPNLVIDASGPFQNYGDDRYQTVRAAIATHTNYLDFADSAEFVASIHQFNEAAKKAGIFVLSGVSSFPVLTAAVIRAIGHEVDVKNVTGGIAPSPFAGVGLNVMRAVISYTGSPVTIRRNGRDAVAVGLGESVYYTIAPPGLKPLRNIRFSLVDVPDLQVIPTEYPEIQNLWMGAGPGPEILHLILNLLAKMRATLGLPSLARLSPVFYWVLNHLKIGEHRGGMFVEIAGSKNGSPITRSWHLLAEGDDGPLIPSMAIEALTRKLLVGERPIIGARAATNELELADFDTLFQKRRIYTGVRETAATGASLFEQNLGTTFGKLPDSIQKLHLPTNKTVWAGQAEILRGKNFLAQLVAATFRFPKNGSEVPTRVTITKDKNGTENWLREFGDRSFISRLRAGSRRTENLICESFGPTTFALAMVTKNDRLYYVPRNWRVFGVPMPKFLIPNGTTFEEEVNGRFTFDVEIAAPLIGRIVHYRGWLEAE